MWPVPVLVVFSTGQFMRILFKIYFLLDAEVLQGNTASIFNTAFTHNGWLLMQETSTGQNHKNYVDAVPETI